MTEAQAKKFLGNTPSEERLLEFLKQAKPGSTGYALAFDRTEKGLERTEGGGGYMPTQDGMIFIDKQKYFHTAIEAKAEAVRIQRTTILELEASLHGKPAA